LGGPDNLLVRVAEGDRKLANLPSIDLTFQLPERYARPGNK
jgi:hypothetical protein